MQVLTQKRRQLLNTEARTNLAEYLQQESVSEPRDSVVNVPELGSRTLTAPALFTRYGEDDTRRLSAFTLRLSWRIDTQLRCALLAPIGIGFWWGLPGELFGWHADEIEGLAPLPWGGFSRDFHPLIVEFESETLWRLGRHGAPRWGPIQGSYSMMPRPLWGSGGKFTVSPSKAIDILEHWAS